MFDNWVEVGLRVNLYLCSPTTSDNRETILGSLKSLAQGYLEATALVMSLNIASLMKSGDIWLALLYLLIVLTALAA